MIIISEIFFISYSSEFFRFRRNRNLGCLQGNFLLEKELVESEAYHQQSHAKHQRLEGQLEVALEPAGFVDAAPALAAHQPAALAFLHGQHVALLVMLGEVAALDVDQNRDEEDVEEADHGAIDLDDGRDLEPAGVEQVVEPVVKKVDEHLAAGEAGPLLDSADLQEAFAR